MMMIWLSLGCMISNAPNRPEKNMFFAQLSTVLDKRQMLLMIYSKLI